MTLPAPKPPAELIEAVERVWREHHGQCRRIVLRLDFGAGGGLSLKIEQPTEQHRGVWEIIRCKSA